MKAERKLILSEPQRYILESPQSINLFMGGTGSGKTFLESIISANFIKHYPDVDGFIGANTYEQLNTSTLKRIRDTWRDYFGLVDEVHYVVGKSDYTKDWNYLHPAAVMGIGKPTTWTIEFNLDVIPK